MSDDLATRLRVLREDYDLGDIDDDEYQHGLARLRKRFGAEAVDAVLGRDTVETGSTINAPHAQGLINRPSGSVEQTYGSKYEALIQVFQQAAGVQNSADQDEQRDLLTSYLDSLAERCDRLRLHGVVDWERKKGKAPAFTVSQVYVTLAATEWVTLAEADDAEAFEDELEQGNPDAVLPQDARRVHSIGRDTRMVERDMVSLQRPLLLTEALCERRQVVLLGGPGGGKSTFLRHLAVALARAGNRAQQPDLPGWSAGLLLPLYASLGGYAAWAQKQTRDFDGESLWDYLLSLSEHDALRGLRKQIRRAFRNGTLLLLLDGLDEVADPTLRVAVAQAVARLAGHQRGFVIVTCRVRSFVGPVPEPLAAWGDPLELAPFTLGQMQHFVRGWYARSVEQGAFDAVTAAARAEHLVERLRSLETLRDLGTTPLLLTIITILHYYEGKLPEDRADLYEDMVQLLLTRWTQHRREAGAPPSLLDRLAVGGLRDYHLRNVLEDLAYQAHQSQHSPDGRGALHQGVVRETLLTLFKQFDLKPGPANEKTELVLGYLEDESGLLLHEGDQQYVLPHLTYEEYLAGCHLVKQKGQADFRIRAYGHWQADASRWREVIFLALGRMVRGDDRDPAAAWLHFLVAPCHGERQRSDDERQRAAFFAGECLDEMGGKAALIGTSTLDLAHLWQQMADALVPVVESTTRPAAERVQAGVFLGSVGDPRTGVCTLPPAMVEVPGGRFVMGISKEEAERVGQAWERYYLEQDRKDLAKHARTWPQNEINDQPIAVTAFALARYPVTNAQYKLFLDDGGYDPQAPWWDEAGRTWLLRDDNTTEGLERWRQRDHKNHPEWWHDKRFGIARPNHPVVGVSWYEAMAFCRWLTQHLADGYTYRLPSEAEWEYAARRDTHRTYPWGNEEPDTERANFEDVSDSTTAVGCFPLVATPDGLYDLAGNVWDWTRSEYRAYPYDADDGREDTSNPAEKRFTLRGGGWGFESFDMRVSGRYYNPPDDRDKDLGFRLARHLAG